MPIEDADKVSSKRGSENVLFTFFGYKISIMKFMFIAGGGFGGLFIIIAAMMMMTPAPVVVNTTPVVIYTSPTITMSFEIIPTSYNYKIIQITYSGTKLITDFNKELVLSMYPPSSPQYVQRQLIMNDHITIINNTDLNKIYIYTGTDNLFHASYSIPKYEDCIDFIDGQWSLNIDDGVKRTNLFKFNFITNNSKTKIMTNTTKINDNLNLVSDFSTIIIYSGTYKERLNITKPVRLIGLGEPIIDAGGFGSDIIIHSNNTTISGFTIINSGINNLTDGGIVIKSGTSNNIITKNHIYKTVYGIWLYKSNINTISNNSIYNNDYNGIMMTESSSNIINNNVIYNNINGIYADSLSNFNTIQENKFYNNKEYGAIIENYKNLNNICEYNTFINNKMSCGESVDRDTMTTTIQPTVSQTRPVTTNDIDDWDSCEGNPKCYQS